ncbi:MAG: hypothetical protein ACI8PB_004113, partial [Desulforhopalus sp.]
MSTGKNKQPVRPNVDLHQLAKQRKQNNFLVDNNF